MSNVTEETPFLTEWCEMHHEKTNLRCYAVNPPVNLLFEHILSELTALKLEVTTLSTRLEQLSHKKQKKDKQNV